MKTLYPSSVIIVYGLLIYSNKQICDKFNLKIYLDTDDDTRLSRRISADCLIMKKPLNEVIDKYLNVIKPSYEQYVLPYKKIADIIFPDFGGSYSLKYKDNRIKILYIIS